ncbi:hypothetical protein LguiB_008761 [Lonicera macranthoides]
MFEDVTFCDVDLLEVKPYHFLGDQAIDDMLEDPFFDYDNLEAHFSNQIYQEPATKINLPGEHVFTPLDADLIQYYLKRRAANEPNEKDDVHMLDVDPFESQPGPLYDPYHIFAGKERELYCYTKKRKSGKYESTAIGGFWKTFPDLPIKSKSEIIGHKRYLAFHEGTRNSNTKSEWVIHEYRFNKKIMENDWLLCKVTKKIKKMKGTEGASEPSSLANMEERMKIMSDDILNAIGSIDVQLSKVENENEWRLNYRFDNCNNRSNQKHGFRSSNRSLAAPTARPWGSLIPIINTS